MHIIWGGNLSKLEIIGRCVEDEKKNDHAEPKVEHKKQIKNQ